MNRLQHKSLRHTIQASLLAVAALAPALTSCTLVTDDVSDCPNGLYVRFVYDYNIQRADMFKDHARYVTVYVFDEQGRKVAERSESADDDGMPLADYGYSMRFTADELPAGRYRLQAVAMQRDWDEALKRPGAKYRRCNVTDQNSLTVRLDYDDSPLAGTNHHHVSHGGLPLDTLWHTLKVSSFDPQDGCVVPAPQATKAPYSIYPLADQYVTVRNDRATYATISLIRDTKHINLTLRQLDDPANMSADDYEVHITDDNSTLLHDNSVSAADSVRYTPYSTWTSKFSNGGIEIEGGASRADDSDTQRTAHYNMMTNRIMFNGSQTNQNAMLVVTHKSTGNVVARLNLPYYLAQARIAYDHYNYSPQEYLDREYDYHLNLFLKGETWEYCDIVINVLNWSHRVQNHSLGK